jgi:O-acetyl-ADP-ribose deacetylase (regulator of RNase III)
MTIIYTHGDLLSEQVEALVNTVNTEGVSGKGIALQFRLRFPQNFKAYRAAAKRGEIALGHVFPVWIGSLNGPAWILNFPTKGHWRSRSRLADIEAGLDDLIATMDKLGIASVAVPPLGCGNGGLEWRDVRSLIEEKLGSLPGTEVHLFAPEGAPTPASMRVATKKPRMSIGRAVLIVALDRYIQVADGASRLVAQKLAYLLQVAGAPLRLSFAKAQYGPYAEQVNFVLQDMEGHYTTGYGDRTTPSPLQVIDGVVHEAEAYLADRPELAATVSQVQDAIAGLESPYGLELLSTVHFVATNGDQPAVSLDEAITQVQEWSARKGRLFTDQHIRIAWERLRSIGWLPTSTD